MTQEAQDPYPPLAGYGPPAGAPPWAHVRPTNTKAVLSVALLWVPVASIVFAVLARREIARTGEAGAGLAAWGLGIGIAIASLYALYAAGLFLYAAALFALVGVGASSGGSFG
ncbi:DUF4190 domain-containing protein [Quadrisphaera sp. INWT6]|uniref:DUF4190 domain-containing protein n=1 Tax=Quadrisphaera sp. INWT6 TaxID=2596917 RepID=UPI0018923BA5|nr:DUF4190 domain-containing protein [Quadrisphaera sp. INWT6]MBF5083470.1 DUF4190 domain-containing protein [Quadrisphaera sp. INWT6]